MKDEIVNCSCVHCDGCHFNFYFKEMQPVLAEHGLYRSLWSSWFPQFLCLSSSHIHFIRYPPCSAPGEGEAAVLSQAMRSELVLCAPGCCPKWVTWQHGPPWERKRNPLGYDCTCLRRPHADPWVWQQTSSSVSFPGGSDGKESTWNAGGLSSIPASGRSPGGGNCNPLQRSCLGNPMDRGAWWATVHGVAKEQTISWFLECLWGVNIF